MSIQIPAHRAENPYRFQSVTIYSQKAVKSFKNDLYTVNRKARALWENFFHLFLSYILYNGKGRSVMLRLFSFVIVFCIVSCGLISFVVGWVFLRRIEKKKMVFD